MAALPRILGTEDLPLAELGAARLDGELFRCARAWGTPDVPGSPADRAAAAMHGLPRRWTAELETAAWIWGACDAAPDPVRVGAARDGRGARTRPGVILREISMPRSDAMHVDGIRLTTPRRTAEDLLRAPEFDETRELTVLRLLELIPARDRQAMPARLRRLPYGAAAIERFDRINPR